MPVAAQLVVPVAVPLPPALLAHVTRVTPTLSEAVPPSVREAPLVLYVDADVGVAMATAGRVASRVTVILSVALLPVASRAAIVSTFVPGCRMIPLAVQLVVPVAVP